MQIFSENPDELFNQAVGAGCEVIMPMETMFWGERMGNLKDPYEHLWAIVAKVEYFNNEKIYKRADNFFKEFKGF